MSEDKYSAMSIPDCAKEMVRIQGEIDEIKSLQLKSRQAEFNALKFAIIPEKMTDQEIKTITVEGVGRITVLETIGVSTVKEMKLELYEWLKENGAEALIGETINSSTLAAFIRERIGSGLDYPVDCLNVKFNNMISITK
jgi:hypothetical protein